MSLDASSPFSGLGMLSPHSHSVVLLTIPSIGCMRLPSSHMISRHDFRYEEPRDSIIAMGRNL